MVRIFCDLVVKEKWMRLFGFRIDLLNVQQFGALRVSCAPLRQIVGLTGSLMIDICNLLERWAVWGNKNITALGALDKYDKSFTGCVCSRLFS